ncbi:hypothetical protein H5410_063190 [Solanum commersonii]|uniref:Uncharacterized protein n=1 Tax=Solanum commersonii TaxID=4109 RepID=A0A9J5WEK3_SOLCO|nr:hypothetical protein H5410_063190 [Solanum commersonii]
MSFLVKHSSTREGEETTRTGRDPNRRYRWPIMGKEMKELGGRFWDFLRKWFFSKYRKVKMSM